MAAPKRTSVQREYDLQRISDLYLRGNRQVDIAETLGISQPQVSRDLAEIQQRWRTKTALNLDEAKARELARIDALERTYWAAWERSCGVRTKRRRVRETRNIGASLERETMLGNPAYLAGVQWCISERCKLLGIYAPAKAEVTGKDGAALTWPVLVVLPENGRTLPMPQAQLPLYDDADGDADNAAQD